MEGIPENCASLLRTDTFDHDIILLHFLCNGLKGIRRGKIR